MRHLLLLLLPALVAQTTMAQNTIQLPPKELAKLNEMEKDRIPSDAPVTGTTTLVIRGSGAAQGSMPLTTWQAPLIWHSNDGKAFTQGPSGHLVPYRAPVTIIKLPRWTYAAYGAAVTADYLSTRYALSHGATDAMYRCNPYRAGCMNQATFWTVAAIPVGLWLLNNLWLHKRTSPQWQRFANFGRKLVIGGRFGVAAYNFGIANGIKGGRNGQ